MNDTKSEKPGEIEVVISLAEAEVIDTREALERANAVLRIAAEPKTHEPDPDWTGKGSSPRLLIIGG